MHIKYYSRAVPVFVFVAPVYREVTGVHSNSRRRRRRPWSPVAFVLIGNGRENLRIHPHNRSQ